MEPTTREQPSTEPGLCSAGCGFWGNPATEGFCSKCYREQQAQEKKITESSVPAPAEAAAAPVEEPPAAAADVTVAEVPAAAASPVALPAEATTPAAAAPERPVQANRNRCFSCNKKVGLLGFECRCGYTYCSSHRHASDHKCDFDYVAFDKERLTKANPVVAAAKLADKL